jgi:pyruvate,water dikinase
MSNQHNIDSQVPLLDEFLAEVKAWVATRPDLATVNDADLVEYGRAMAKRQNRTWDVYAQVVVGATVGPAIVQGVADAVGKPELGLMIFAALGEVASAGVPERIWELSRMVNGSPEIGAAFDDGVDGLHERLAALPAAASFNVAFAGLLNEFGHRGVNEWELSAETWRINPSLAYDMIDRVRKQDDSSSPTIRSAQSMANRIAAEAELSALVAGDEATAGMLAAGINSGQTSYRMREAGKNAAVQLFHEPKLAFRELGRRMY